MLRKGRKNMDFLTSSKTRKPLKIQGFFASLNDISINIISIYYSYTLQTVFFLIELCREIRMGGLCFETTKRYESHIGQIARLFAIFKRT